MKKLTKQGWYAVLIVGMAILIYANSLNNGFTHDDVFLVEKNVRVTAGMSQIPQVFVEDYWFGAIGKSDSGLYRPLVLSVYNVLWRIGGGTPFLFHLLNVLLFALSGFLLLRFLLLLHGKESLIPFFAALIFVVHPLHTESVANVKGLAEIFVAVFLFASSIFVLKHLKTKSLMSLSGASLTFFLALMSKEESYAWLVVFPALAGVSGGAKFLGGIRRNIKILIMLAGIAALAILIRLSAGVGFGTQVSGIENPLVDMHGAAFFATTMKVTAESFIQLLIPYPLIHDYSAWQIIPATSFASGLAIAGVLMLLGLVGLALAGLKKNAMLLIGVAMFLFPWLVSSNLIVLTEVIRAERLMFLPLTGFSVLFAGFVAKLFGMISKKSTSWPLLAMIPIVTAFSILTVKRNPDWRSNETLYRADYPKCPDNVKVRVNYASVLYNHGVDAQNNYEKVKQFAAAKNILLPCLKISPDFLRPYIDLGYNYEWIGQYDSALYYFSAALVINPSDSMLAVRIEKLKEKTDADFVLANDLIVSRQYIEAEMVCLRLANKYPNNYQAWYYLGGVSFNLGKNAMAKTAWLKADSINPRDERARNSLKMRLIEMN
ncbi:MAG: hypothetical protein KKA07_04595 [Bacteroidetes bacterium]|nr:hypothetical protein [Bacteroidota bacterium]MBU1718331.1 hypothetical protein [Bacteroidota bacterium]